VKRRCGPGRLNAWSLSREDTFERIAGERHQNVFADAERFTEEVGAVAARVERSHRHEHGPPRPDFYEAKRFAGISALLPCYPLCSSIVKEWNDVRRNLELGHEYVSTSAIDKDHAPLRTART
jgi:hypothetical protein